MGEKGKPPAKRAARPTAAPHPRTAPRVRTTAWESVARRWHKGLAERADSYHASVVAPNLLRVLKPVKGMHVIDIGCGDGFITHEMAAYGAEVVGTDISPEMVKLAQKASAPNERYVTAPAEKLSFAKDASFDAATIVLALQNIEHLDTALAEAARVLCAGGRLLIVLNHPAFRIPKRSSWGWDDAGVQYRRLDSYMSEARERIDMEPGKGGTGAHTYSFHRPLQVYVKALAKAGFVIDGLEEWISHRKSEAGPRAKAEDTARKEFPLFLLFAARKV